MTFAPALASGIDLIGAALLHFVWQGVLLGAVYVVLRPLCANVVTRYRLGIFMLLMLAVCPALTLAWIWPQAGIAASTANGPLQQMVGTLSVVAGEMPSSSHFHRVLPWLVAVWIGGVFTIGMRSLWQWRRLLRVVAQASALPEWEARLADLCARFGLRRSVRLMVSTQALTPMLIGLFKPVILLPASMLTGFAPDQLELIIAHELGHVRRWDYLVNLIQVVIETVLFYHPVVHWISRDVRNLREECCDDLVLHVARGNPLAYARALADLEELRQNLAAAPALSATGGILLNRVRRIVGAAQMVEPLPRNDYAWPILVVVLAIACMVWRSHVTTEIPDAGRALAGMPAHALALVSGNPTLIEPVVPVAPLPVTVSRLQNTDAQVTPKVSQPPQARSAQVASETLFDPVQIAQPKISIALHHRMESVSDLVRPQPLAATASLAPAPGPIPNSVQHLSQPFHMVAPIYPSRAMLAGITGNVELAYSVDSRGHVRDIRVVQASPSGVFEFAAKAALSSWEFPVSASGARQTQNFAFTLKGHESSDKCQQLTGSMICRQPSE